MDLFLIPTILLLTFTFFLVIAIFSTGRGTKNGGKYLPPGPVPLPIIGSLHKLGSHPHKSLAKLAEIYGPIMSLKLGQVTTVVITSSELAKEVLQTQDAAFSSRFVPDAIRAHAHYRYSMTWLPVGTQWRSLRKILNTNIFVGNRLDAYQHLRCAKVQELIAYVRKSGEAGEVVDVGRAAFRTSLNLLSNMIFSADLADVNNDSAKELKDLVSDIMVESGKPNLVDYFPFLGKVDPQGIRRRMAVHLEKVIKMFGLMINERLELRKLRSSMCNNDLLDILLNIEESGDDIERNHVERMCLDQFVAGTDTMSSTLEWAMAEILRNPVSLLKAKAEFEQTIGKGKAVEESDIASLPYLQSIIKETLRLHPPAPFLIPRKVEGDCEVSGYSVPKGSQVLVNVWAIGRDPSFWDNATKFMPERFLNSKLDIRGRDFELIPFGAGRRICPGMPLAIRMVPVMLGSLLNLFDWKLEGGTAPNDLNMEEKFGLTLQKEKPLSAVPILI